MYNYSGGTLHATQFGWADKGNFYAVRLLDVNIQQNPRISSEELVVQRRSGLLSEAHGSCEELVRLAQSGLWQVPKVFQSCREGNS